MTLAVLPAEFAWLHEPPVPPSGLSTIGITIACIGAVILAMVVTLVIRRDRARHGPAFRLLARAIGVSHEERRLIHHLARTAGVPPATLLISRGAFETAVETHERECGEARGWRAVYRRTFDE